MEIHRSGSEHGDPDEDVEHALATYGLEGGEGEARRTLVLGPDRAGDLLEVLELDDGRRLAIDAMRMRPIYRERLP